MEVLKHIFFVVAEVIEFIAIGILIFGLIKSLFNYLKTEFKEKFHTPIRLLQIIRCEIGIYILLALDFLIAADLIQTVTDLTQEKLIELGVMIVLRTIIGYFLGKEVEDIETRTLNK